jgi:cysteinyl-tRNA synthetase
MYVCGPTVDGVPHLGHGRFSLVFDVLRRYLLFTGLEVTYVSNITDIEDKIIARAEAAGLPIAEFTAANEALWWAVMDALGVMRPDETPHATAYVDRMIDLVEQLVERGVAYETGDGVYLSVMDVPGYGLLARQPLSSLRAGARVEADEEKRSPLDFVLWKKAKEGEPSWEAPWGAGRPGWHTECVVMSLDLLGDGFDLHGGAIDLIFPHHENERAQAVAVGRDFAHHWVHNGWVTVDGEKMSKSLGNFTSLSDLLERSDARAYRLLVLRSHYRSPIEVTRETIADAEAGLARLDEMARRFGIGNLLADGPVVDPAVASGPDRDDIDPSAVARFRARMDDDLDTPGALAILFELVRSANSAADAGDRGAASRAAATAALLGASFGLTFLSAASTDVRRPPPSWSGAGMKPGRNVGGTRPTLSVASWKRRDGWWRTGPPERGSAVNERRVNSCPEGLSSVDSRNETDSVFLLRGSPGPVVTGLPASGRVWTGGPVGTRCARSVWRKGECRRGFRNSQVVQR